MVSNNEGIGVVSEVTYFLISWKGELKYKIKICCFYTIELSAQCARPLILQEKWGGSKLSQVQSLV